MNVIRVNLLISGGEHSHSHAGTIDHLHESHAGHGHAHTLEDLAVGISVLGK